MHSLIYVETSAKDYHLVEEAFVRVSEKILNKIKSGVINVKKEYGIKVGN